MGPRVAAALLVLGVVMTTQYVAAQARPTREVKLGLLPADISEVDGAAQTFSADVYMRASWRDPALADPSADALRHFDYGDVWHPTLAGYNVRSASKMLPEEVMVRLDGRVTHLQRFVGEFSDPMDLEEFPRDSQEFSIRVVAATGSGANVTLVPDHSIGVLRSEELSVSDWQIGDATLFEDNLVMGGNVPTNPGVTLRVPAVRRVAYSLVQVLIPLIAIVMMA